MMVKWLVMLMVVGMLSVCIYCVEVVVKELIIINLNVKVDYEICVKVDKEFDILFSDDSELF